MRSNTDPVLIYQMLTEEWGLSPPHLVMAVVGGDELAQMRPWLRDTLRKGLVKAAQSTGYNKVDTTGLTFEINSRFLYFPLLTKVCLLLLLTNLLIYLFTYKQISSVFLQDYIFYEFYIIW